jgi:hypothetical protein
MKIKKINSKELFKWILIGLISLVIFSMSSCTKDQAGSGCWTCIDNTGTTLQVICAGSEQEAFEKSGLINGVHTIANFRNHCSK